MTKALNIFAVTKTTNKKDGKSSNYPFDGLSLDDRNPDFIQLLLPIWEWLYRYYFRVQSDGWHHVPASGKMLVVGSHNGGIAAPDMFMFLYEWFRRYGTERLAYGLMHPTVWQVSPDVASMAVQCGALKAHPKMAIAALRKNAPVLVYPGGAQDVFRPHHLRDRIYFAGRKGFIKLALREEVPIVPIISHGAHDTLIVLADLYEQAKQLHELGMPWLFGIDPVVLPVYLGLPWGLSIGPLPNLPLPVQIRTRVCEPIVFERYGSEAARDRDYVDACFERVTAQMQEQLDCLAGK
ncbi:lysophospholipid acyltransferase family protein [Microcoleus sp. Pol7_A1]|uniref:lysophospholipid acyltransferase family protein n=1 Tax=unclassified Microcoleus TaxID=2642155 RepID=UPI002FD38009